MSLLHHCVSCDDSCCKGRTLVTPQERDTILAAEYDDHLTRWSRNIYYLDHGPCSYLREGRCSVQEYKPFVCQVFPFVPRVAMGTWWLYLVSECPASLAIPSEFVMRAVALAKSALKSWNLEEYESYWNENKLGDFAEDQLVLCVPVYPDQLVTRLKEDAHMKNVEYPLVPGCLGTSVELVGDGSGFQVLRVKVEDGGKIPLHAHDCAATMVILEGSARTLGKDGRRVKPGDVVVKGTREPHGFTDVDGGFAFLSISTGSGIVRADGWDLQYL